MPFTLTQVSAMPTEERNWRFLACTNDGGLGPATPVPGWDSAIVGDTTYYYRAWLEQLLWPEYYAPGSPPVYCSTYSLALAGASRVGIEPDDDTEDADALVCKVLATVGH